MPTETGDTIAENTKLIKEYFAPADMDVKARIINFLEIAQAANNNQNQRVMSFEDTEVNEAVWLMEGASNFLANVNLCKENADNPTYVYSASIPTYTDTDQTQKISSEEIISKFNEINDAITVQANAENSVAKLVNFEFLSLDNSAASIQVKTILGKPDQGSCGSNVSAPTVDYTDCSSADYLDMNQTRTDQLYADIYTNIIDPYDGVPAYDVAAGVNTMFNGIINHNIYLILNVQNAASVTWGGYENVLWSNINNYYLSEESVFTLVEDMDPYVDESVCLFIEGNDDSPFIIDDEQFVGGFLEYKNESTGIPGEFLKSLELEIYVGILTPY